MNIFRFLIYTFGLKNKTENHENHFLWMWLMKKSNDSFYNLYEKNFQYRY